MRHTPVVGSPSAWARDFALFGLALGGAAPFFVIFDASFAVAGALVGASSGYLLGGVTGWTVERIRNRVPLPVLVAAMAVVGSIWGAAAGAVGGATGTEFGGAGILLGFIVGGCTGMAALTLFFPSYLLLSVRGDSTRPLVSGAMLLSPLMGWLGLAALLASTFGLWLFALPPVLWIAIQIDRSMRVGAKSIRSAEIRSLLASEPHLSSAVPGGRQGLSSAILREE